MADIDQLLATIRMWGPSAVSVVAGWWIKRLIAKADSLVETVAKIDKRLIAVETRCEEREGIARGIAARR